MFYGSYLPRPSTGIEPRATRRVQTLERHPPNETFPVQKLTFLAALAGLLIQGSPASAGVWNWGCQGRLGDQQIVFDYSGLYITESKAPDAARSPKPPVVTADTIGNAIRALKEEKKEGLTEFEPAGGLGLDSPPIFSRTDAAGSISKVTFTEKASRRTFHRHKLICGRDEDTDLFSKVYRYERDGEPARDITMQCYEYQLSTRGGRKDCND